MRSFVLVVLSVLLLSGCGSAKPTAKPSAVEQGLEDFQGTWTVVSMEMDGKFLPDEKINKTKLTIEGEHFSFETAIDSHHGLYKIDPTTDPKQLNIEVQSGDEKGKVYLVIYRFDRGKMIQCMQLDNMQRPSEFTGKAGSGNLYEIWQRQVP